MYKCSRHEYHLNHLITNNKGVINMRLPSKPTKEQLEFALHCKSRGQATKQQEIWIELYTPYYLEKG